LHRDIDEIAEIGDEVTVGVPGTCAFMPNDIPHAWKNTGDETGRVLCLYIAASAGGYIEALSEHRPTDADEHNKLLQRHRWKVLGPNPL
jgi:quercetin dioxygenase-like cupin family protein